MTVRSKISSAVKITAAALAFAGIAIALFQYRLDGYSAWYKRLYYFTNLSNVWIAASFIALVILPYTKYASSERAKKLLYTLKYVFTVSITITGFVYCVMLAPFIEDGYRAWSISSVLLHVVVPLLSVIDFFLDAYPYRLGIPDMLYTTLPPVAYFIFAGTLSLFEVDFGLGDPYPYFFLNMRSPAGFFGTSDIMPFAIGTFYWILIFLCMVLSFALIYLLISNRLNKKND